MLIFDAQDKYSLFLSGCYCTVSEGFAQWNGREQQHKLQYRLQHPNLLCLSLICHNSSSVFKHIVWNYIIHEFWRLCVHVNKLETKFCDKTELHSSLRSATKLVCHKRPLAVSLRKFKLSRRALIWCSKKLPNSYLVLNVLSGLIPRQHMLSLQLAFNVRSLAEDVT